MTHATKRSLERRLSELEADDVDEPDPGLNLITCAGASAELKTALLAELEARGEFDQVNIVTDAERADFVDRLDSALETLGSHGGVDVDREAFTAYVAGRRRGEIASGAAGVRQYFDVDVTVSAVDRVWHETVTNGTETTA